MKKLIVLFFILMLTPAFSLIQSTLGIYVQNRILWIPFGFLLFVLPKYRKVLPFHIPLLIMLLFFVIYCMVALYNDWNIFLYCAYFLTFLLLFISSSVIYYNKEIFLSFFKLFFILNAIYIVYQIICYNLGFVSLTMMHSNLPAQQGYIIPTFITPPFIRYTGLFNESSPLAFYLCICFCFFKSLRTLRKYQFVTFLLLLFSGSKFAYIFLLCHFIFLSKNIVLKCVSLLCLSYIVYLVLNDFNMLLDLTGGEAASIDNRMKGMEDLSDDSITNWGEGLQTSSNGEVALNMFSILLQGFGIYGMSIIMIAFVAFFKCIDSKQKYMFLLPFAIGIITNGSLLIIQYSLILYCLIFLHHYHVNECGTD